VVKDHLSKKQNAQNIQKGGSLREQPALFYTKKDNMIDIFISQRLFDPMLHLKFSRKLTIFAKNWHCLGLDIGKINNCGDNI